MYDTYKWLSHLLPRNVLLFLLGEGLLLGRILPTTVEPATAAALSRRGECDMTHNEIAHGVRCYWAGGVIRSCSYYVFLHTLLYLYIQEITLLYIYKCTFNL